MKRARGYLFRGDTPFSTNAQLLHEPKKTFSEVILCPRVGPVVGTVVGPVVGLGFMVHVIKLVEQLSPY